MGRETWELAQKLRKTPKRTDTLGEANPLTGLLENAMQEKLSLVMLLSAKQETSRLLKEDAEERQARQMSMQRQAAQQKRSLRSAWKKKSSIF